MLDNDEAGFRATQAIALEYSYRVRDFSDNYRGYSDLNDYLCGRKQEQKNSTSQAQEIKQETGQRQKRNDRYPRNPVRRTLITVDQRNDRQ